MTPLRALQDLVRDRAGLAFCAGAFVAQRYVQECMRELGLSELEQLLHYLSGQPLASEAWAKLIALATNPLTYFFRDHSQLKSVVTCLEHTARENPARKLQIWSAGCSSGEEPYTLAMLCLIHGFNASILATDVNPAAVSEARRAVYARWSLRHVDPGVAAQFFVPTATGSFEVSQAVRACVHFCEHNLSVGQPPLPRESVGGWDLILCRNVLIYYSLKERRAMVDRLSGALRPGGVLFLGSSELVSDYEHIVRSVVIAGRQALRRTGTVETAEPHWAPVAEPPDDLARVDGPAANLGPRSFASAPPSPTRPPGLATSLAEVQEHLVAELTDNRLDAATALLLEVVARAPHDLAAQLSLGHLHIVAGDLDAAEHCYECARRLDPLLHEAYLGLGVARSRRGDLDNALRALQRAVFLEPRFWATAYLLGDVAERLRLPQIAAREFRRAQRLLEAAAGAAPLVTHPIIHSAILPRSCHALERLRERDSSP